MPMNVEQINLANRIHKDLFSRFVWTSDQKVFGVGEFWDLPVLDGHTYRGDCDDFAMEMDRRLKEAGVALQDRRFGVCSMSGDALDHCVLILLTEKGIYVSECNTSTIVPISALPYTKWYWSSSTGNIKADWELIPGL